MAPSKSCRKFPQWLTNLSYQEPGPSMTHSTAHSWCLTKKPRSMGSSSSACCPNWLVIKKNMRWSKLSITGTMGNDISFNTSSTGRVTQLQMTSWPSPCQQLSQEVPPETPPRWKKVQNHEESMGQSNHLPHTTMLLANSANIPSPTPSSFTINIDIAKVLPTQP